MILFQIDPFFWTLPSEEESGSGQEAIVKLPEEVADPGEGMIAHGAVSEPGGSTSEEEQQMANALLSTALGTSFLALPEVPRRSSKRLLSESSEDPSQPEKRRKALALLVDIKAAKSLKLAKPDSAVLSSEPVVKNCLSTSSGISL